MVPAANAVRQSQEEKSVFVSAFVVARAFVRALWGNSRRHAFAVVASKPEYWVLAGKIGRWRFQYVKASFESRLRIRKWRAGTRAIAALGQAALRNAVAPTLALVTALLLDRVSPNTAALLHLPLVNVSEPTVEALAAAVLQVCVVLVGLYYAAISIVISTVYKTTSEALYDLINESAPGAAFMNASMALAVFAAEVLSARALNIVIGSFTIYVLIVLVVLDVLAFVRVGKLGFALFNPRHLLPLLMYKMQDEIEAVTPPAPGSGTPEEQDTRRRQSSRFLDALSDIGSLCSIDGGSTIEVVGSCCGLLQFYGECRGRIDPESRWFERSHRFKNWFQADPIDVMLALNAAREVHAEEAIDNSWFERRVLEVLRAALDRTMRRYRIQEIELALGPCVTAVASLARAFATDEVETFVSSVGRALREPSENAVQLQSLEYRIGYNTAGLVTSGLLGLILRIKDIRASDIRGFVKGDRSLPMFGDAYSLLKEFNVGIKLEVAAEGSRITPAFYVEAFLAEQFMTSTAAMTGRLLSLGEAELESALSVPAQSTNVIRRIGVLSGFVETCEKYQVLISELEGLSTRLRPANLLPEVRWKDDYKGDVRVRALAMLRRTLVALAEMVRPLVDEKIEDGVPNFVEATYQRLAWVVNWEIDEGNAAAIAELVGPYLAVAQAMISSQRDIERFQRWAPWIAADLFELGGYAIIVDRLFPDRPNVWPTYEAALDLIFSQVEVLRGYTALAKFGTNILNDTRRSMVRQSWKQSVDQKLRERGILDRDYPPYRQVRTGDTLLDSLAGSLTPSFDLFDVFCAVYVLERDVTSSNIVGESAVRLRNLLVSPREPDPEEESD